MESARPLQYKAASSAANSTEQTLSTLSASFAAVSLSGSAGETPISAKVATQGSVKETTSVSCP